MLIPRVVKDHNSKTAILIKEGRKFVHYIPMKSGKLTVKRVPMARFYTLYQDADIPVSHAVNLYLKHSGGMTEAVTTALKEIASEHNHD
jgi:hypothetical protein